MNINDDSLSLTAVCIPYTDILNIVLIDFLKEYNSCFVYDSVNNKYIFAENVSKQKLEKYFENQITTKIEKYFNYFKTLNKNYRIFIVATCKFQDNVFITNKYIRDVILNRYSHNTDIHKIGCSYIMQEADIVFDMVQFEDIAKTVFSKLIKKFSKKSYCNMIIPVSHNRISCHSILKHIQNMFGKNHSKRIQLFSNDTKDANLSKRALLDLNDIYYAHYQEFYSNATNNNLHNITDEMYIKAELDSYIQKRLF